MSEIEISLDISRIDFQATSEQLKASYWGADRTDEGHARAFKNSVCVAAFLDGKQVGFGRAITDRTYFAYLSDVIVWPEQRGKGVGKKLIAALLDHPELADVSNWSLRTGDAHKLYEQFGFKTSTDGMYMRFERTSGR
jgi:GNAT superfamily N-acetyltransferase